MTLASYIRSDLRARLLAGDPGPLTLRGLSQRYGVSLTPVREAVEALIRERVLRKGANGRLAAGPARGRRLRRETVERPRGHEREIARDVMRRSLRGDAAYLREEAAAAQYGIGRTALRQVFHRLAGAGMLEHVPRRGWRVHPFREEEMDAYLDVREVMELKALDLALPRLRRAELERLLADNRVSGNGGPHVDSELHAVLVEASGNRYIRDFFGRHGAYYATLFYYAARGAAVVSDMARQHREILGALLRGRADRARRTLARHIRDQRPVLRKMRARLASLPVERWPEIEWLGDDPATSPPRTL